MKEMIQARKEQLQKRGVSGFTLMEMLIVVAIIAVLVAIAIPVFTSQLDKANTETDAANIRSGYAVVAAKVMTDNVANNTTYTLNSDGTVTETATTAYTCKGAGTNADIAGQTITWTKGATVTYTISSGKVTINIVKAS